MRREVPEVPISADLTEILERAHDVKSIIAEKGNVTRDGVFRRSAYQTQLHNSMEESRQIVLAALRQGKNISEAMELAGRTRNRFYAWCRESTKFEQQANEAVAAFSRAQTIRGMSALELNSDTKKVIREDFSTWTEYIVAFRKVYFGFDTFDHQWRMLEAIEKAPDGGVTEILTPPMSGKTTLLVDIIVADLCADPNHRACFISGSLDFSVKQMGRVQRRLNVDGPPTRLIVDYGPFTTNDRSLSKKWNSQEITILASDHDEAEPSLGTYGMTGNIRGTRWNRMYLDDIQSVRTKNLTPNLIEIFRQDTMTRPVKSGKIIITGSRVGKNDVYEEFERLDLLNEIVVIPAMDYSKEMGKRTYFPLAFDHNNVAIVDDAGDQLGFSDEWMETRRKQVGEDQWSRVYMMRPMSEFSAMVTEGDIANATDRDRVVGQQPQNSVANIAGLDPSLAAHAAYTYCAFDSEHLYVMGLTDLFKPNTNQRLFEEVRAGTIRYRPEYWVIENNTLQRGYLTDDAFLEMQEQYGFNAIGHHTGDNKLDPQLGVPSLMAAIVRGEVRFPTINENDTAFATLFDQLMSWRQDIPTRRLVQDQVMSLWFCYLLWRKLRDQVAVDLSGWKRQGADSVTMYPYATSNISGLEPEPVRKAPMTYAQHWDELSA